MILLQSAEGLEWAKRVCWEAWVWLGSSFHMTSDPSVKPLRTWQLDSKNKNSTRTSHSGTGFPSLCLPCTCHSPMDKDAICKRGLCEGVKPRKHGPSQATNVTIYHCWSGFFFAGKDREKSERSLVNMCEWLCVYLTKCVQVVILKTWRTHLSFPQSFPFI